MIKRNRRKFENYQWEIENQAENLVLAPNVIAEPENKTASEQLVRLIENCIDKLPDEMRIVFVLRTLQQLNNQEIAEILDMNPATVKTRFHRARERMQKIVNQQIESLETSAYEFAGIRCDNIVSNVLKRISEMENKNIHDFFIH